MQKQTAAENVISFGAGCRSKPAIIICLATSSHAEHKCWWSRQLGFNTVLYDRSLSRFRLSCFTLHDVCLLLLKVYWCWRQSVSTLYSSIKHGTCTFTFAPHLLIAASSVWPHWSSDHMPNVLVLMTRWDPVLMYDQFRVTWGPSPSKPELYNHKWSVLCPD